MDGLVRALVFVVMVGACAFPVRAAPPAGSIVVSLANDRFLPRAVVQQGNRLDLVQADPIRRHDLTARYVGSNGAPLFGTGRLVDFGEIAEVEGVPELAQGTYPFYCIEHPWMYGELIVV